MALRLKLVPDNTKIDFFRWQWLTFGSSIAVMIASLIIVAVMGLNFGIDFRGGTTIRTESSQPVDVGAYREALQPLGIGDVIITEVFDPTFRADQHVASIRIEAQEGSAAASTESVEKVSNALRAIDPSITFPSVESVGPKVSGELVQSAVLALGLAALGIGIYIWFRFEWQFAVGTILASVHDVLVTVGILSLFQMRFDLTTVAALLTILGFSVNDTVVVFDRLRENLQKYKTMPLRDVMNLSVNETLSRTVMTVATTLIALFALLIFGGDVLRGFVSAIIFGVLLGTYSSIYMAKNLVLWIGVNREPKPKSKAGTKFADIDA
ncbi:protein translocase subunit SecF [Falsirhodobacter sp. 20TX0035]|uniref:protein translocase subunit SecF n=1 Tax=Falsirhodobacter sp. 20TX0035 TaxID=3022019 RepID=UPI0023312885|nr:protein translocase subunit SecF [Falsirhodobacter sp. 20TX0035]MDB6453131.1 protein translocase subunit SecF [Falsirhodobacter sp. 20TX0035]